jgi:very-short-patch-repair endonuclease
MKRKKALCEFCNKEFAVNMLGRHRDPCKRRLESNTTSNLRIEDVAELQDNGMYSCNVCKKEYAKKGISTHYWLSHGEGKNHHRSQKGRKAWNKGLTADLSPSLKQAGETLRKRYTSGELIPYFKGKKHSDETRKKISEGQSLAQKEGRAWNIGMSRWRNTPSYPESFFMEVIKNEFHDKEYMREYPLGRYSLDFAWPHKQKCIEIDGKQHYELREVIERDERKNAHIDSSGWSVLRIKWKDLFDDTIHWIEVANNFIG